ncbi:MAG: hypothetical protein GC171_10935 [Terrimonas sp.]|nr:hypothetical protein [Terrimonas sp.]
MRINIKWILFISLLVLLTVAYKIFLGPDVNWSGFSPVMAIAVFSGMIIKRKNSSFLLPLLALLVSDIIIEILFKADLFDYEGFYAGQWKNYGLILTATLIGWGLRGRSRQNLLAGAIAAPTVYFFLSNTMVWMSSVALYTKDFSGLMNCYTAGLPFYRNSLIATIVFLPLIMVAYNYIIQQRRRLTLA